MQEIRELAKTGNTYLKTYTRFYMLWQLITIILFIIAICGLGVLLAETKGLINILQ